MTDHLTTVYISVPDWGSTCFYATCFYAFVNSMINFTNMYIITFVHYIGIFFSVPSKHEMCKYKYIYIYIFLRHKKDISF